MHEVENVNLSEFIIIIIIIIIIKGDPSNNRRDWDNFKVI